MPARHGAVVRCDRPRRRRLRTCTADSSANFPCVPLRPGTFVPDSCPECFVPAKSNFARFRARPFVFSALPPPGKTQAGLLSFVSAPDFSYLWLRLRYFRPAKCKQACFCPRFFRYLWLRLRYSRSAKCKQACFCPRLFVSLSSQTQTTQRPWDSYRSHSST